MKISRSYLLGLGSGLILSALLAMVIPPISINFTGSPASAQDNSGTEAQDNENLSENNENIPENPTTSETEDTPIFNPEDSDQPVQTFVIPSGSTADRIADLLLVEGWITSKGEFLDLVRDENLASRFRAGSFELTQGMTYEEILAQLIR